MVAMDEARNPYATPKAVIAAPEGAPFFAVSTPKLVALSLATFSLYVVVWSYYSWKALRPRLEKPIWPFWRAVFAPIWMFSLLEELNRAAREARLEARVAAGFYAIAFFVLNALWRLPTPYSLVSLLAFTPLLPANSLARRLNETHAPDRAAAVGWSGWNVVALVGFGLLALFAVIGMLVPPIQ